MKTEPSSLFYCLQCCGFRAFLILSTLEAGDLVGDNEVPIEPEDRVPVTPSSPIELSIVCVGDVMVHRSQIASQYDSGSGTYNYDNNFQYVKKYIEAADLALCNVETTFAGGTPTGYPSSCSRRLSDVANAGFDVGITSNNHLYDKGLSGMKRTLDSSASGLPRREPGCPGRGTRFDGCKGVKVAIIAYTYETPSNGGRSTINGVILSDEPKS